LKWQRSTPEPAAAPDTGSSGTGAETHRTSAPTPTPAARVRRADRERSRRVLAFETLRSIHTATVPVAAPRPDRLALLPAQARDAAPDRVPTALPEPPPLDTGLRGALHARRSSFGRFSAQRPTTAAQLSAVLAAAVSGAALACNITDPDGRGPVKLYAFVNHVEGIAPGTYEYDQALHDPALHDPAPAALRLVAAGPPGEFLQRNYFLANYNLEQAGAVIVPTVRTHAVLDAVGDRGYRFVNALIGAAAQAVYTASAAAGLACGVALGFDAISYIEHLGLADDGEIPLLTMLIGDERPRPADFRYEFAPAGTAEGDET
jgi:nitroreductase